MVLRPYYHTKCIYRLLDVISRKLNEISNFFDIQTFSKLLFSFNEEVKLKVIFGKVAKIISSTWPILTLNSPQFIIEVDVDPI